MRRQHGWDSRPCHTFSFYGLTIRAIHTRSQCSCELQGCSGLQRLSEPASSWAQAGRRHAGRPAEAVPVHQAWGRRFAAMGGNPSKVAASVFCTATLNRFNTPPVPALGEPRLRSATGNGKRSRRRKAMSADNAHLFFVFATNSPALEIRRKSASKE